MSHIVAGEDPESDDEIHDVVVAAASFSAPRQSSAASVSPTTTMSTAIGGGIVAGEDSESDGENPPPSHPHGGGMTVYSHSSSSSVSSDERDKHHEDLANNSCPNDHDLAMGSGNDAARASSPRRAVQHSSADDGEETRYTPSSIQGSAASIRFELPPKVPASHAPFDARLPETPQLAMSAGRMVSGEEDEDIDLALDPFHDHGDDGGQRAACQLSALASRLEHAASDGDSHAAGDGGDGDRAAASAIHNPSLPSRASAAAAHAPQASAVSGPGSESGSAAGSGASISSSGVAALAGVSSASRHEAAHVRGGSDEHPMPAVARGRSISSASLALVGLRASSSSMSAQLSLQSGGTAASLPGHAAAADAGAAVRRSSFFSTGGAAGGAAATSGSFGRSGSKKGIKRVFGKVFSSGKKKPGASVDFGSGSSGSAGGESEQQPSMNPALWKRVKKTHTLFSSSIESFAKQIQADVKSMDAMAAVVSKEVQAAAGALQAMTHNLQKMIGERIS